MNKALLALFAAVGSVTSKVETKVDSVGHNQGKGGERRVIIIR